MLPKIRVHVTMDMTIKPSCKHNHDLCPFHGDTKLFSKNALSELIFLAFEKESELTARTYSQSSENPVETQQHLVTQQSFVSLHTHTGLSYQVASWKPSWGKIYQWKDDL